MAEDDSSATGDSIVDDMLMLDNDALRERVACLEKKVQEQGDEMICLRSTLADAVRRIAALETSKIPIANHVTSTPTAKQNNIHMLRRPLMSYSNNTSPTVANVSQSSSSSPSPHNQSQYAIRRRSTTIYQSQTSLHSDGQSSSSTSPVPSPSQGSVFSMSSPSPSPRHSPSPNTNRLLAPFSNTNTTQTQNTAMKKWASTLDFNGGGAPLQRRFASSVSSGSMLNLHVRQTHVKHGTKDAVYNAEEGCLRLFLHGRPIILYAPTSLMNDYSLTRVNELPHERLKLDWVYGYRGRDCRSNLHYLPTGEIIYFVAAVVVLYNVEDRMQRHYVGHTDDVKCIAIHPNRLLVATGQTATHLYKRDCKPHVRIWESVSLNTLQVIGFGDLDRSVACIAFSKLDGGALLCAVDEAPEHNMGIWEWQRGQGGHKIYETKSSTDPVLSVEFHPMDKNVLITCGKGHVNFWTLEGALVKQGGVFDKRNRPKYVLCMAFSDTGDLITGDSSGHILIWQRGSNRVSRVISNAHDGVIFSVCALKDGRYVTGGGKDRRIREWDNQFQSTGNDLELSLTVGAVRTLIQGRGNMVLVGTVKNCILEGTLSLGVSAVMHGHTEDLYGLAVHPNQNQFVTAGMDKKVYLWDTMSHGVVWSTEITEPAKSAAFSPDGSVVVVGTVSGQWYVFDSATRATYANFTDGSEAIDVIKFSPDGAYLALGSHDNYIYIYQVDNEFRSYARISKCVREGKVRKFPAYLLGHSNFVTHLDWSAQQHFIQSNSADMELLYWNAPTCRQVAHSSSLRDVDWSTQNCTLGFTVIGIWPESADGTDINTCSRSHNRKLLASGDNMGRVNLFSYPVSHPKAHCHMHVGHSSHVTKLDFLHDDTRLISLGGKDSSIMQWTVS